MRFFLPAAILVALLLYGHGLEAPYYLDDPNVINTGSTIPRLLSPRSLGYTTFFLSEKSIEFLSGLFHWEVPFYFRFANLLIHVLTATLVVGLVLELSKRYAPALVAGTLFLVHPIVSQPVMYISQRFESLATLFMVASLSTYVRFRSRGNSAWLAVAMASAGAAVLSKETAVVLPVWILVVEVVFFRSAGWDRRYIYLLPAAALLAVPGWWSFRSSAMTLTSVSWDQYFALQGSVLVKYLQLCLYPAEQFLRYGPGAVPASLWRNLADWGLALAVLSVGIVLIRRHRIIGFGIVTFFVMLLPVTFLPLPDLIFEHRIYPAFVGLAVAAGGLFGLRVNKLTTTVVVALLFTYGIRTFNRTTEWNNQTTFYQGHVRAFPADSQSLTDLAGLYYLQGHTNLARETLELARLNEGFLNPYYSKSSRMNIALNMVSFSLALDDVERAESELNRALALDSNAPPGSAHGRRVLCSGGRTGKSSPGLPQTRRTRARIDYRMGRAPRCLHKSGTVRRCRRGVVPDPDTRRPSRRESPSSP